MKTLLQYQVERQKILQRIKVKIGQNLDLRSIIQTGIEESCHFLELDRLLIYQLNVSLESNSGHSKIDELVDLVTYEARKSKDIASILYFQDEMCFRNASKSKNKYRQGFSLAVNDIENSNFTSCLKALMRELQVKAKIVTPIEIQGKLWGLMIAHQCFSPRQWQNKEIQFLRQIAEYLAISIYQSQSYQQLQRQKILLEKRVKAQAQQIRDALIAAEAASRSKHEFIGSMSHELRTPLTCVIGLSGTLLQWSLTKDRVALPIEKQQEYLKQIQESGKYLLNLINNILEFSEVESGKNLLNINQISLANLARKTLQLLQEEARKKQISLNLEYKILAEQDLFAADGERLKEILLNLVSNGIKFTPSGGKVILRIWREKHQVIFQVEDTGIGIAEAEIPLLFEKFKQLENFRQRTHGGTGLGLALTKQLIELHGGNIEVESVLGEGSIFTFYLPEKTQKEQKDQTRGSVKDKRSWRSRRIMLITKDEENATFICQLLTAIGYQVVWLIDSTMAIKQIKLLEPNVVIIDRDFSSMAIQMITKEIGSKKSRDRISLILLCCELTDRDREHFSENGVDDYLLKSMNPTEIIEKIIATIEEEN